MLGNVEKVDCRYVLLDDPYPSLHHDEREVVLCTTYLFQRLLVRADSGRVGEFIGCGVLPGHSLDADRPFAMLCCDNLLSGALGALWRNFEIQLGYLLNTIHIRY